MDAISKSADRNASRLRHEKALDKSDKVAVVDTKSVIQKFGWVHKRIVKLINLPISSFVLKYHKRHGEYLIEVLVAVRNTRAVTDAIAGMKSNMDSYIATTDQVLRRIQEIPEDPFPGINALDQMALAQDPDFAATHDAIIEDYQRLARNNVEDIAECAKQGRDIYADTSNSVRVLLDELAKAEPQSDMEKLIIETNKRDIKWLQLYLDKIRTTYQKADAATARALKMEEFANGFVKIRP